MNSIKFSIKLSKEAEHFYLSCNLKELKKIDKAIDYLSINPYRHPNIRKLTGQLTGYFRYRAGNLRLVYSIHEKNQAIIVYNIGYRGNIYQ